jgi:hypothetical protein
MATVDDDDDDSTPPLRYGAWDEKQGSYVSLPDGEYPPVGKPTTPPEPKPLTTAEIVSKRWAERYGPRPCNGRL